MALYFGCSLLLKGIEPPSVAWSKKLAMLRSPFHPNGLSLRGIAPGDEANERVNGVGATSKIMGGEF